MCAYVCVYSECEYTFVCIVSDSKCVRERVCVCVVCVCVCVSAV
jgi:hypothetical protein